MKSYHHVNAKTVEAAVESLRQSQGKAKLNAGGTDLLGALKDSILPVYPETIVNLKTIAGLDYVQEDSDGLRIGALAGLAQVAESPIVREKYKILADAAKSVASPQIRNLATIGGNLCQEVRCWYYRYPHQIGGRILCMRKRRDRCFDVTPDESAKGESKRCSALLGDNRYHSIFGAVRACETPCTSECPAAVDIPSYMSKIREGDLKGAAAILLQTNPIPGITGRVCPHFCQQGCNRGDWDAAVSIRGIERFMGDYILENAKEFITPPDIQSGKRVAVIGSGPGGLSAAFYLRRSGHEVVVFERMDTPGGIPAHAIPAFRLPGEYVNRLINAFQDAGIEFRLNTEVGVNVTLKKLREEFDAVFLATGSWALPALGLENEDFTESGLDFLINVKRGTRKSCGKKVLVIGGGNVAIDAGITAMRLGAETVTLACLETLKEMPALAHEIEKATEEGVKLMPSWGPLKVLVVDGKVEGMELVRCTSAFDKSGAFSPVFENNVIQTIEADQIIMAIGQKSDFSYIVSESENMVEGGVLLVEEGSQQTVLPTVFAGGDLTNGPSTVVQALAAGKRAAAGIDRLFGNENLLMEANGTGNNGELLTFNSDYLKKTDPVSIRERPREERRVDTEDIPGLESREVEEEANRCFNCGCVAVNASDIAPVLIALGATIKTSKRIIQAEKLFSSTGGYANGLDYDEVLTDILVPTPEKGTKWAYDKFRIRQSVDFAIASLATVFIMDDGKFKDARIVLGAVGPIPVKLEKVEDFLKGKAPGKETAARAAEIAVENIIPLDGNKYKASIVKTLVKRAILSEGP